MCGIAGVFRETGPLEESDRRGLARMLAALAHRGPDGEGALEDRCALLGHRRLAIIDLSSAAREPLSNETEDVFVVFNGEIYNFRELRSELKSAGHRFRSETDAEVLVHGYEAWGIDGILARIRGMFAFALLDRRRDRRRLYLARDRFGIKPLYYARVGERLVFASELSALAASGLVAVRPSSMALAAYLSLGSVPAPETALEGFASLPAGHFVELTEGEGTFAPRRYYELSIETSEDGSPETLASRLRETVDLHLVSDVPLGCFLSGGIDSASLVALASQAMVAPLATLSLVFDDPRLDESGPARAVAEHYRTEHREVRVGATEFRAALPGVFRAMDQPSVDGVNAYIVSRAAKEAGLVVVLTGLGGDEVFLGYPHFRKIRALAPWLGIARLPLLALEGRHPKLAYLRERKSSSLYSVFRGLFAPREVEEILPGASPPSLASDREDPLDAAIDLEFRHYLHNQLLRDTDAMSMAHSIEARVPFLDHLLVESVLRVPHREKLAGAANKPLLLNALDEPLPREVWDRPKQGFTLPFRPFLLEHRGELVERTLGASVFRERAVHALWDRFAARRAHWSRPWALVAYAAWLERFRELAASASERSMAVASTSA